MDVFHAWLDGLQPVRTTDVARELRVCPERITEYTVPLAGERVRGRAGGRWFGEGIVQVTNTVDGDCLVIVDRPLLAIVGQLPFRARTTMDDVWLADPEPPAYPVMWRMIPQICCDWALMLDGRDAARQLGLRVFRSARWGVLLGTDRPDGDTATFTWDCLHPYFDAMANHMPLGGRELLAQQGQR